MHNFEVIEVLVILLYLVPTQNNLQSHSFFGKGAITLGQGKMINTMIMSKHIYILVQYIYYEWIYTYVGLKQALVYIYCFIVHAYVSNVMQLYVGRWCCSVLLLYSVKALINVHNALKVTFFDNFDSYSSSKSVFFLKLENEQRDFNFIFTNIFYCLLKACSENSRQQENQLILKVEKPKQGARGI